MHLCAVANTSTETALVLVTVVGVVASPREALTVSAGSDTTVRLMDYEQRRELHKSAFSAPCSKIVWIPTVAEPSIGGAFTYNT